MQSALRTIVLIAKYTDSRFIDADGLVRIVDGSP